MIAILIGDRSGLDRDTQRRLREAGTYHIIAISGENIAILGALVLVALRLLRCGTRMASVVTAATLGGYRYLVGSDASVVRATIGAAVFLGARAADHRTPPLNALALVAAIMLVATPLTIFDAGFALTFGVTLAILIGAPRIYEAWCRWMPDATGLVESAALVEWMPWASQRVPPPPVALLAVYYGGWIVWLSARRIPRLR